MWPARKRCEQLSRDKPWSVGKMKCSRRNMFHESFRGTSDVIELKTSFRSTSETFPYSAVDLRSWHRRHRVVCDAPCSVVSRYVNESSAYFLQLFSTDNETYTCEDDVFMAGDLGLGFALDDKRKPVISIEAAVLLQLVRTHTSQGEQTPLKLHTLQDNWCANMCFFVSCSETGWRGCFSEHRLWMALTPIANRTRSYPAPVVRGWFSPSILEDIVDCIGKDVVGSILNILEKLGHDGLPDLVLYRRFPPMLWFVEVKSERDNLTNAQIAMMNRLSTVPGVCCQVCVPPSGRNRIQRLLNTATDSDSD